MTPGNHDTLYVINLEELKTLVTRRVYDCEARAHEDVELIELAPGGGEAIVIPLDHIISN